MKKSSVIYPGGDLKTARDWHIYHVYNDPEFNREVTKLNADFKIIGYPGGHIGAAEDIAKRYKELQVKYAIEASDIDFYISELHRQGARNRKLKHQVRLQPGGQRFEALIDPDITKDEFNEIWNYIERIRRMRQLAKSSRRKPPQETQLIYALFRAKPGRTFKQLFALYQNGSLPLYSGSTTQFKSEDSLERYYQKYRPDSAKDLPAT